MKKNLILILCILPLLSIGQSPQKINFQSVLRNSVGEVLSNKSVSIRISILSGSTTGTNVYSETHSKTTDASGLLSIQIGNGTVVSGLFRSIEWSSTSHFIKLEADFNGGTNFVLLGTQELMSVPYALYASKTDTSVLNLANRLATKLNSTDTASLSNRIAAKSSLFDTSLLNLTSRLATKLNGTDTASLSNRIDAKLNRSDFLSGTTVIAESGIVNNIPKFTGTTNLGNSVIYANAGNVGIGTASPYYPLQVGNTSAEISLGGSPNANGTGRLKFINSNVVKNWQISSNDTNSGAFEFTPSTTVGGSTFSTPALTILSDGKVGIGTTSPNYKLHVEGSGTANEVVGWFNNQGSFSTAIAVRNANKTAYLTNHAGISTPNYTGQLTGAISLGASAVSPIQFYNAYPPSAKMTILENGKVGIGTTSPAYPLEVSGSAKFTTIRDSVNSVGTAGQVLSSTGSAVSWTNPGNPGLQMAVIRETQASNVASGVTYTTTTNAFPQSKPRQFNSKAEAGLGITLNGSPNWTFTISTAGTYLFEATAMLSVPSSEGQTVFAKLVLNNQSLNLSSVIVGDSYRYGPVNGGALTNSNFLHTMNGIHTITGTTVFTLDHVIIANFFPPTGGQPSNISGYEEVYATLKITKIN